jgi:hypothetical protein
MFTKEEMAIDSHDKGSGRSHNQKKKNSKAVGIKRMSDEEFEKEMVELKVHLSVLKGVSTGK